jgi:hypothetical protein
MFGPSQTFVRTVPALGGKVTSQRNPFCIATVFCNQFLGAYVLPVFRIRIHMFLGHSDPLVRGMDPDPDPSSIEQKW